MPGQRNPATKGSGTLKDMLNDVIEQAQKFFGVKLIGR
jgi:hypothetical protein